MEYDDIEERYFARHILVVRLCNDGILIKDVVYELWRDDNFDFATFDSLRSRVNQLTRSALLLRVGSGLRKQEMLRHSLRQT
jgi:hypothetical protein